MLNLLKYNIMKLLEETRSDEDREIKLGRPPVEPGLLLPLHLL